jgi:hypothetical protein
VNATRCKSAVSRVSSMVVLGLVLLTGPALAQKAEQPDVKSAINGSSSCTTTSRVHAAESRLGDHVRHAHGNRRHREQGAADADPGLERS